MAESWQAQMMTQGALSPMALLEDREYFGCLLSPRLPQYVLNSQMDDCHPSYAGQKDKKKKAHQRATDTINSAWASTRRSLYPELKACLEPVMENSPVPKQPKLTATKKSLELVSPLKLEPSPSSETARQTGIPCGRMLNQETWNPSPPMSEWFLIVPLEQSGQTTPFVLELKKQLQCFGVLQVYFCL